MTPSPNDKASSEIEILWKRANRQGRYYDKPIKFKEFSEAIENLIAKRVLEGRIDENKHWIKLYNAKLMGGGFYDADFEDRISEVQSIIESEKNNG